MKRILPVILVVVLFSCSPKTDDPEKLKTVLKSYFEGISRNDYDKMRALTTPDFQLYEHGEVLTNDSLINLIAKFPNVTRTYSFDNFHVNVDQQSGSMRYFNHGEFVVNDTGHVSRDWMESATFKKVDGEWKLDFLHSSVRK